MSTFTNLQTFELQHCYRCGIAFAMPADFVQQRLRDQKNFWCPNGHDQHFVGKTKEQELKEELDRERRRLAFARDQRDAEEAARLHAEAQARGYKGALTKAKKRAAAGVCPAPGCKRSFADVAAHVAEKHPELAGDTDA